MLVVGANLAVDRTVRLTRLVPGQVQRPYEAVATGGGKAVNVARAARAHGVRAVLVANLPGRFGAVIGALLADEGHALRPVATSGEARAAVILLEDDGRTTVLNEPGPPLSTSDAARLLNAVAAELATGNHRVVVATGSLPPAAPPMFYGQVADLAHAHGCRCLVDAARGALRQALAYGPDVVSPNLAEAEAWLHGNDDRAEPVEPEGPDIPDRALGLAAKLVAAGAGAAFVSAGAHGVAGQDAAGPFWVPAPDVPVRSTIGAGDALSAGAASVLERGGTVREAARVGVATASASVAGDLAGSVPADLLARLLKSVVVEDR